MRRLPITPIVGLAFVVSFGLTCRDLGLRVNTTDSMPVGIWRVLPLTSRIRRGEVVTVCLPIGDAARLALARNYISPGPCASGTTPLLKPVAAIAGDVVTVTDDGISVDDVPIPNSAARARDAAGRPLRAIPPGRYRVEPGQVWLVSSFSADSWDSRYLGPVPVTDIRGTARPLWVFH